VQETRLATSVLGVKNFITWWRTVRLLRVAAIVKKNIACGSIRYEKKNHSDKLSVQDRTERLKIHRVTSFSDLMEKEMKN
jgi:hypothetical protein